MAGTRLRPGASPGPSAGPIPDTAASAGPTAGIRIGLSVLALVAFVAILVVRQGPPAGGDTTSLTAPTTALVHGDLTGAATGSVLPNPPGYAIVAAAVVAPLRAWIGSGNWCATPSRATALRRELVAAHQTQAIDGIGACGTSLRTDRGVIAALPPWYRSQGVVAVLAWVALVVGAVALLRTLGVGRGWAEVGLIWALALLPAASDAIVILFHPQDLLCLGLSLAGLAATFRRRWLLAGALFGSALVTKQFALLILVPALVAVPGWRLRGRVVGVAAAVAAVVVAPLLAVAPGRTLQDLAGVGSAGAVRGATLVGRLGVGPTLESVVARGVPVVLAIGLSLWAARRPTTRSSPVAVLGLVLACLAGRLVFESVVIPYYLLGASTAFLVLDLAQRRPPSRSLAWIAGAAAFLALPVHAPWVDAIGTLAFALVALGVGLRAACRPEPQAGRPGEQVDRAEQVESVLGAAPAMAVGTP